MSNEQRAKTLKGGSSFFSDWAGRRSTFTCFLSVQDKELVPCNHSTESFHMKYMRSATAQILNFL